VCTSARPQLCDALETLVFKLCVALGCNGYYAEVNVFTGRYDLILQRFSVLCHRLPRFGKSIFCHLLPRFRKSTLYSLPDKENMAKRPDKEVYRS